jgi:non-ribosomal peptide synthase protein (TIGR01720 family)
VGEKGKEVPGTRELRRRLQGKLPEYMIPGVVVELEEMPQTPNGKLDRRGLPKPGAERVEEEEGYEEPRSELEEILCGMWEELLGVERVGRRDNFFELGGDSILSLQIVAKARAAGVVGLSVQQMFQYQTVGELARQLKLEKGKQRGKERRRAEGWVELTPIQRWFFEQRLEEPWHFNQAVMLRAPAGAEVEGVEEVLGKLIEHHEALGMRFEQQEDGSWKQRYGRGIEEGGWIERVDMRGERGEGKRARIEEEGTRLQASLDLKAGRLVRGVWFELDEEERRLLLIIHHLVVDGVSWRILLEDLEKLWRQKREGKILDLGRRSDSYGEWSEELRKQAEGEQLEGEWEYWEGMGKKTAGLGGEEGKSGEKGSEPGQVQMELSEEESRILQQEVPRAYQTRIQEVLLTAVVRSLERRSGKHGVMLELEGHGREELGREGVDISRTVGWFTTIYPMYVELEGGEAGNDLKKVKEQMRGVPSRGLGYGVLRYLQRDGEQRLGRLPRAEVMFNYLGQFDAGVGEQDWRPGEEPVGRTRSARSRPVYGLEINAYIREKRLHVHWDYSGTTFDCERTQQLAHDCMAELRQLMEHCRRAPRSFTPSDFPLARLSQNELDLILAQRRKRAAL